jgi:hypothetical protein
MLFFGALIGFAPSRVITGRVIDEGGAPITGVSVLLKATSIETRQMQMNY